MSNKRTLTIQDYSCLGRCSLTVALPTISAMGIECVGIPTALLSNHTAFPHFTYLDLTDYLMPDINAWNGYKDDFDFVYTGYLSNNQVPVVKSIVHRYKEKDSLVFVDPAMADLGSLYPGFDDNHVQAMKDLLGEADYVKLNLTEASLLTDIEYKGEVVTEGEYILSLAKGLAELGPTKVIISGVEDGRGGINCYTYDAATSQLEKLESGKLQGHYHGTGDLFASCLVGGLTLGKSLKEATCIAQKYVHKAIEKTLEAKEDGMLYGPEFERAIPYLLELIK